MLLRIVGFWESKLYFDGFRLIIVGFWEGVTLETWLPLNLKFTLSPNIVVLGILKYMEKVPIIKLEINLF
jgi:hypothetical protein